MAERKKKRRRCKEDYWPYIEWKDVWKVIRESINIYNRLIIIFIMLIVLSIILFCFESSYELITKEDIENCTCYVSHPMSGPITKLILEPLDCLILKIRCGSMM